MSTWHWLTVAFAAFHAVQRFFRPARSLVPSTTTPAECGCRKCELNRASSAAASDIRNPSATTPSAAASLIPRPAPGIAPNSRYPSPVLVGGPLSAAASVRARHR